ncbi:hypothetical protein G3I15_29865, partial [Streptomyces sp. SID10244]|nr:hypothetical protein [Streptomyces sp. SID10244]
MNQQRDIVVKRRMELLTSDVALDELAAEEPTRYAELTGTTAATETADADDAKADAATAERGEATEA